MAKREYVEANKRWLEEKAREEGVQALPRGIYYKVLKAGNPDGAKPGRRSIVTAHYTGWTINGKKFDSSRGGAPVAFRLCELDRRMDCRHATDDGRRQVGNLHTCRDGVWQVLTARHPRWLYPYFRDRAVGCSLTFVFSYFLVNT